MNQLELFHFPPSLCSQKVRLAFAEKGVAYKSRLVDIGPALENYEPWYVRLNPAAVVPTLRVGDQVVTDSARIVRYVDAHCEGQSLVPSDPGAREQMERWIDRQDEMGFRELSYGRTSGLLRRLQRFANARRIQRLRANRDRYPELAELYTRKLTDIEGLPHCPSWRRPVGGQVSFTAYRAASSFCRVHVLAIGSEA